MNDIDLFHRVMKYWDIPACHHNDFGMITLGCAPKSDNFFMKLLIKPHYRKALIECLKEMKF